MTADQLVAAHDVWTYDTAWHRVSATAGPTPRLLFGMAEDAATGMIVVYGGAGAGLRTTRDTWLLDPRTWTWTHVPTLATPTADAEVGMAWLPSLNAVVVTGGSAGSGTGVANSTWVFDRAAPSWREVQTNAPVPSMHLESTLTTDSCHGFAIFLGPPDQVIPPTHADYTWILK